MSLRVKKTLLAVLRAVVVMGGISTYDLSRPHTHFVMTAPFTIICVLWLVSIATTWWLYGDSDRAVAQRARAEEKRAARRAQRA